MCDYSLEMYGSRPAREGEHYVTTRFPSGVRPFVLPTSPELPPSRFDVAQVSVM